MCTILHYVLQGVGTPIRSQRGDHMGRSLLYCCVAGTALCCSYGVRLLLRQLFCTLHYVALCLAKCAFCDSLHREVSHALPMLGASCFVFSDDLPVLGGEPH